MATDRRNSLLHPQGRQGPKKVQPRQVPSGGVKPSQNGTQGSQGRTQQPNSVPTKQPVSKAEVESKKSEDQKTAVINTLLKQSDVKDREIDLLKKTIIQQDIQRNKLIAKIKNIKNIVVGMAAFASKNNEMRSAQLMDNITKILKIINQK